MIRVACPCGEGLETVDKHVGRTTACPMCGSVVTFPAPETEAGPGSRLTSELAFPFPGADEGPDRLGPMPRWPC
jgi:hypothetical protein